MIFSDFVDKLVKEGKWPIEMYDPFFYRLKKPTLHFLVKAGEEYLKCPFNEKDGFKKDDN